MNAELPLRIPRIMCTTSQRFKYTGRSLSPRFKCNDGVPTDKFYELSTTRHHLSYLKACGSHCVSREDAVAIESEGMGCAVGLSRGIED